MDTMTFSGRISRLAELAEGWENHDNIDPIERDIALELLRGLYAELRFGEAPEQEIVEETVQVAVPEPEPLPEPGIEYASSLTEARQSPEGGEGKAEGSNFDDSSLTEPHHQLSAPEIAPETEPEPEPLPEPEPAPAVEDMPVIPRRGFNPEVIRSLYGDSAHVPSPQEPTAEPEHPKEEEPAVKEAPKSAAGTTLGDTINTERQTLGETLQNGRKDMASQIAASEHPDLKRSIGINDKFLMIRDMFDGDAAAYEAVITRLDTFTDLDDAIIYIHDNYNWNADSDGVKLLIDLLERKLG